MTKHEKHIAALTRAVKKAKNPGKVKVLIRNLRERQAKNNWLGQ